MNTYPRSGWRQFRPMRAEEGNRWWLRCQFSPRKSSGNATHQTLRDESWPGAISGCVWQMLLTKLFACSVNTSLIAPSQKKAHRFKAAPAKNAKRKIGAISLSHILSENACRSAEYFV